MDSVRNDRLIPDGAGALFGDNGRLGSAPSTALPRLRIPTGRPFLADVLPQPESLRQQLIAAASLAAGGPGVTTPPMRHEAAMPRPEGAAEADRRYWRMVYGVDEGWWDIPVLGRVLSSAVNVGASTLRGIIDTTRMLGLDNEITKQWSDALGKINEEHYLRSRAAIQRALLDRGFLGGAAEVVAQTALDLAAYLWLMGRVRGFLGKHAFPFLGPASEVGLAQKTGSARLAVASKALRDAAWAASWRFLTQPGDFDDKRRAAAVAFAYMITPAFSGQVGLIRPIGKPLVLKVGDRVIMRAAFPNDWAAKAVDFMLNSGLSVATGQYEEALRRGYNEAVLNNDAQNAWKYQLLELIPVVGPDIWFSSMTRSYATIDVGHSAIRSMAESLYNENKAFFDRIRVGPPPANASPDQLNAWLSSAKQALARPDIALPTVAADQAAVQAPSKPQQPPKAAESAGARVPEEVPTVAAQPQAAEGKAGEKAIPAATPEGRVDVGQPLAGQQAAGADESVTRPAANTEAGAGIRQEAAGAAAEQAKAGEQPAEGELFARKPDEFLERMARQIEAVDFTSRPDQVEKALDGLMGGKPVREVLADLGVTIPEGLNIDDRNVAEVLIRRIYNETGGKVDGKKFRELWARKPWAKRVSHWSFAGFFEAWKRLNLDRTIFGDLAIDGIGESAKQIGKAVGVILSRLGSFGFKQLEKLNSAKPREELWRETALAVPHFYRLVKNLDIPADEAGQILEMLVRRPEIQLDQVDARLTDALAFANEHLVKSVAAGLGLLGDGGVRKLLIAALADKIGADPAESVAAMERLQDRMAWAAKIKLNVYDDRVRDILGMSAKEMAAAAKKAIGEMADWVHADPNKLLRAFGLADAHRMGERALLPLVRFLVAEPELRDAFGRLQSNAFGLANVLDNLAGVKNPTIYRVRQLTKLVQTLIKHWPSQSGSGSPAAILKGILLSARASDLQQVGVTKISQRAISSAADSIVKSARSMPQNPFAFKPAPKSAPAEQPESPAKTPEAGTPSESISVSPKAGGEENALEKGTRNQPVQEPQRPKVDLEADRGLPSHRGVQEAAAAQEAQKEVAQTQPGFEGFVRRLVDHGIEVEISLEAKAGLDKLGEVSPSLLGMFARVAEAGANRLIRHLGAQAEEPKTAVLILSLDEVTQMAAKDLGLPSSVAGLSDQERAEYLRKLDELGFVVDEQDRKAILSGKDVKFAVFGICRFNGNQNRWEVVLSSPAVDERSPGHFLSAVEEFIHRIIPEAEEAEVRGQTAQTIKESLGEILGQADVGQAPAYEEVRRLLDRAADPKVSAAEKGFLLAEAFQKLVEIAGGKGALPRSEPTSSPAPGRAQAEGTDKIYDRAVKELDLKNLSPEGRRGRLVLFVRDRLQEALGPEAGREVADAYRKMLDAVGEAPTQESVQARGRLFAAATEAQEKAGRPAAEKSAAEEVANAVLGSVPAMPQPVQDVMMQRIRALPRDTAPYLSLGQRVREAIERVSADFSRLYKIVELTLGPEVAEEIISFRRKVGTVADGLYLRGRELIDRLRPEFREALSGPSYELSAAVKTAGDELRATTVKLSPDEKLYLAVMVLAAMNNPEHPEIRNAVRSITLGRGGMGAAESIYHLDDVAMERLIADLTPAERKIVDEVTRFMDTDLYSHVAAEYLRATGRLLDKRLYYSAMYRDLTYTSELGMLRKIGGPNLHELLKSSRSPLMILLAPENSSFLQETTASRLPLLVGPLSTRLLGSIEDARHYLKASPMRDWLAANIIGRRDVRTALMQSRQGRILLGYLDKYYEYAAGVIPIKRQWINDLLGPLLNNMTLARLFSPRVWSKQAASVFSAAAELGVDSLRAFEDLRDEEVRRDVREAYRSSPILRSRAASGKYDVMFEGPAAPTKGFTKELAAGELSLKLPLSENLRRLVRRGPRQIFKSLTRAGMAAGDYAAIYGILAMARRKVLSENPSISREELVRRMREIAEEVTIRTQVATDDLDRSLIEIGAYDIPSKMLVYLSGAVIAKWNVLSSAVVRFFHNPSDPEAQRRLIGAVIGAAVLQSLSEALVDLLGSAVEREAAETVDNEEAFAERVLHAFRLLPIGTVENVLRTVPLVGGAVSAGYAAKGYRMLGEKDIARLRMARVGQMGALSTFERDTMTILNAIMSAKNIRQRMQSEDPDERRKAMREFRSIMRSTWWAAMRQLGELTAIPVHQIARYFPSPFADSRSVSDIVMERRRRLVKVGD